MKRKAELISLLFFLFFFLQIQPVSAYLPYEIKVTETGLAINKRGLNCLNSSTDNNIYCYIIAQEKVYRFNETLQDKQTCTLDENWIPYGIAISTNNTRMWVSYGGVCHLYNISDFINCDQKANGYICSGDASSISVNNGKHWDTEKWIYWANADQSGIHNEENVRIVSQWWFSNTSCIAFPNRSDNNTMWASRFGDDADVNIMYKYTGGSYANVQIDPSEVWGFSYAQLHGDLVMKNASETYGYFMEFINGNDVNLYRVNFTQGETENTSVITAVFPLNATVYDLIINLEIRLTTELNGTIDWYLDGANIGSTTVTSAPDSNKRYTYSSGALTEGDHYWNATYTDSFSNEWATDTIYFSKQKHGFIEVVGNLTGDALGVTGAEAQGFIALLIAFCISGYLALKTQEHTGQVFTGSFIALLLMFTFLGWLPVWIGIIIIIGVATLFATKMSQVFHKGG